MSDVNGCTKLQALVYDFLSPTAVIADYAIGLGKLSANEQPFVGSKSVTDDPIYIRFLFYDLSRCVSQHKQSQYRLNRDRALFPYLFFFIRGGRASSLCTFLDVMLLPQSYWYPYLSGGAPTVSV